MYLKRLYAANKWWFAIIVLFIVTQLFMDIRQNIDISPVYHYGMYSGVIAPQQEYTVTEIKVNDSLLETKDFSPLEWDKITLPVTLYAKQQGWNTHIWNDEIKRLLHVTDSAKYINSLTPVQFNDWYKNYLPGILHQPINTIDVAPVKYTFNGSNLIKQNN